MCGIYGCISHDAGTQVLEGLRKLEYRGYDSAGLAVLFPRHKGPVKTEKSVGFVSDLVSKANGRFQGANIAIGHTRWATHGGVTDTNAHPHNSSDGKISLVHNGIIENAMELSEQIIELGYSLSSETDTEVIVHLLDYELKNQSSGKNHLDAFCTVVSKLEGSWSIAVIISDLEGILISKNGAPLVIGKAQDSISISSDLQSFYGACSEISYIEDGSNFLITPNEIITQEGLYIPKFLILEGTFDVEDKGVYEHMMLKEIHDQPNSLSNALSGRISADGLTAELSGFHLSPNEMKNLDRINIIGCGTAYYAATIISEYVRKLSPVICESFVASEFPAESVCSENTLTIGISQSGETKDTLDALLESKKYGGKIGAICNVIGSTLSRYAGNGAYLYAGPEYAVASTKVFTNMIAVGLIFALTISDISKEYQKEIVNHLRKLPNLISKQLIDRDDSVNAAADLIVNSKGALFIGRGPLSSNIVKEGALKMIEVSYISCLALPGGELKHGPIALIQEGTPVVAVAPTDDKLNLMESSIRECKARGAKIILITDNEGPITKFADIIIQTHETHELLSPFSNAIILQLLAYHAGVKAGINVDRPRNLAKSVTVV